MCAIRARLPSECFLCAAASSCILVTYLSINSSDKASQSQACAESQASRKHALLLLLLLLLLRLLLYHRGHASAQGALN
jgi:hypothetical protein